MLRLPAAIVAAAAIALAPLTVAAPAAAQTAPAPAFAAPAAAKYKFKNCTALNKVYPHGVGRSNARDKTSSEPVTNFTRSTSLYKKIMADRKTHDRDKDGIACERA